QSFAVMLEAAGSDLSHVLHINVFLLQMSDFEAMNAAYVEMMGEHRPARTVVAVRELPKPGVLLTMNLTAVTKKGEFVGWAKRLGRRSSESEGGSVPTVKSYDADAWWARRVAPLPTLRPQPTASATTHTLWRRPRPSAWRARSRSAASSS